MRGRTLWKRREAILIPALLVAGIIYAIVDDSPVPPSADAQKPVAVACLEHAGFNVKADTYDGGGYASDGRDIRYELDVDAGDGHLVAILYLADLPDDAEPFADHLKDYQKTYGDYEGETIEQRGTAVIRLAGGFVRVGAIYTCVDRAAKAKET